MPSPRIAIVGTGPSGLTLTLLLLLHTHSQSMNMDITLYDLRPRPPSSSITQPAGMLDLHPDSGLAALSACNLLESFNAHVGVCSEDQIIVDRGGEVVYRDYGEGATRPEISRNVLTQLLLNQVEGKGGRVRWGWKLRRARRVVNDENGAVEVELDFGEEGKERFDFVVGADGTWSKVRRMLTHVEPEYTGIHLITVTAREVSRRWPEIAEFVGSGGFMCLGQRHGVLSQRAVQDSVRVYICISTEDEQFARTSGVADKTAAEAKEILLNDDNLLGRFGEKVKDLVRVACDEDTKDHPGEKVNIMPLYRLPVGHSWEHKSGVTVIGDAAHVMPPWAGEGVNLAMKDALELSKAIVQANEISQKGEKSFQSALDPLVRKFEVDMVERAREKGQETFDNGHTMFGNEDGSRAMADWFRTAMAAAGGETEKAKVFAE